MTREEALRFNPRWSLADLVTVAEQVQRVEALRAEHGPLEFYTTARGGYVTVTSGGSLMVKINPGYLDFAPEAAAKWMSKYPNSGWSYVLLTTFRRREGSVA